MKYKTIDEATHAWAREFNCFPENMIVKLIKADPCDWHEVTRPVSGNRVCVFTPTRRQRGELGCIKSHDEESDLYCIEMDDGELVYANESGFEIDRDSYLPMWGYLWQFKDSVDNWWVEDGEGVRCLSECGFRVYESEEFGYFFGIDGFGYDFYHEHWIPLYKARGLKWADEQYEQEG